jgi:NAD(P)-dependent dehydrogenase (short-subunit alcohol dehydrogenase family)
MSSLQGKVIAITGAASGIGEATARTAAERGASLSLGDVNTEALDKLVRELKAAGANVIGVQLDVSKSSSVDDWISQTIDHFGKLDGAANVAGVASMPGGPILNSLIEMSDAHWDFIDRVNLTGLFYCVRAQMRVMESPSSIVNVSSISGINGYSGMGAYCASKHGVHGLTKVAAKEGGPTGFRVNIVAPLVSLPDPPCHAILH